MLLSQKIDFYLKRDIKNIDLLFKRRFITWEEFPDATG
jgi:RIO-like serine/threonine protein kinase